MTTLDDTTLLAPAAPRAASAARLVNVAVVRAVLLTNVIGNWLRAVKNRRAIYRLGEMSDWELRDIGLTRADLHVVWRTPVGIDPTERLGSLIAARSAGEDAAGRVC